MKKISTLKWTFMFAIMSLFVVSSAASQNFQLAPNGVTVIYTGTTPGATGIVNGKTYTAVDSAMLRDSVAAGADLTVLCTSLVTNMSELFSNKTNFNQDISSWDVSNVTNMSWMFYFATAFNKNIGKWNVANVTDMKGMFRGATAFNQDIGKWNVANVTDMNGMFYNATVFNQDLTQWCVSLIVTKPDNFDYNSELSPSNLPVWGTCPSKFILAPNGVTVIYTGNTPGATGVVNGKTYTAVNEAMLRDSVNAEADLTTLCTSLVLNMSSLFWEKGMFNQDISSWDVSNVTNMNSMFYSAGSFNQNIGSWNVSNVTDMSSMFYYG